MNYTFKPNNTELIVIGLILVIAPFIALVFPLKEYFIKEYPYSFQISLEEYMKLKNTHETMIIKGYNYPLLIVVLLVGFGSLLMAHQVLVMNTKTIPARLIKSLKALKVLFLDCRIPFSKKRVEPEVKPMKPTKEQLEAQIQAIMKATGLSRLEVIRQLQARQDEKRIFDDPYGDGSIKVTDSGIIVTKCEPEIPYTKHPAPREEKT